MTNGFTTRQSSLVQTSTDESHKGSIMAWQELVRYCTWENKWIILDTDCPTETSNWFWSIRETSKPPTPFKALQAGQTVRCAQILGRIFQEEKWTLNSREYVNSFGPVLTYKDLAYTI
jgi:hypothetical protein